MYRLYIQLNNRYKVNALIDGNTHPSLSIAYYVNYMCIAVYIRHLNAS